MFKRVCICICFIFCFAIVTVAREPSGGLIKPREESQPEENTSSYSATQEKEDMKNAIAYRESFNKRVMNRYSYMVDRITAEKFKELISQNRELFNSFITFLENIDSEDVLILYDTNSKSFTYKIDLNKDRMMTAIPAPKGHQIVDEMYQKLISEKMVLPGNDVVFASTNCDSSRETSITIKSDDSQMSLFTVDILYDPDHCDYGGCRFFEDWYIRYWFWNGYIALFEYVEE